jgi:hypothetical protein
VVSIIGCDRFTAGYSGAKFAHERAHTSGPIPVRILRAAPSCACALISPDSARADSRSEFAFMTGPPRDSPGNIAPASPSSYGRRQTRGMTSVNINGHTSPAAPKHRWSKRHSHPAGIGITPGAAVSSGVPDGLTQ